MPATTSVVDVYETHPQTGDAATELPAAGFDMTKPSIIGQDFDMHHPGTVLA